MVIYTVDKNGVPGMPTFNIRKIRKLLKEGKAVIECRHPFTVRLLYRERMEVQPVEACMDAGYLHIGVSVKSEKHEYAHKQYDLLSDEKQRHDDRRKYRRQRRNRLRYRKPRFDNRKKEKGWLATSIKNKMERHADIIRMYARVCPLSSVTVEVGSFDTQLLEALETGGRIPEGKDYQYGARYLTETLRDAVFYRDGHKCLICGKDDVILRVHHIGYWKKPSDHTDRMGNLASVCVKCHTAANHKPGGILYGWKPKLKPMTGAAFMNAVRWRIVEKIKDAGIPVNVTYGSMTKVKRHALSLGKTHANDAYAMGIYHPRHRAAGHIYKKRRRNSRVLEKFYDAKVTDTRTGKAVKGAGLSCGRTSRAVPRRNPKNLRSYRGQKVSKGRRTIRRQRYMIQPGTAVAHGSKRYKVKGVHCNGSRVMLENGKSVAIKEIAVICFPGGWEETVPRETGPIRKG